MVLCSACKRAPGPELAGALGAEREGQITVHSPREASEDESWIRALPSIFGGDIEQEIAVGSHQLTTPPRVSLQMKVTAGPHGTMFRFVTECSAVVQSLP